MSMEIAVTIKVSMMTAKRPNSPEKGFHVEDNINLESDWFCNILVEPVIRIINNKKNKNITDTVTKSIILVPKAS